MLKNDKFNILNVSETCCKWNCSRKTTIRYVTGVNNNCKYFQHRATYLFSLYRFSQVKQIENLVGSMSSSSISRPSTPLRQWDNFPGNSSSIPQPTTPLISRRNISAVTSPRDTNPFRAEPENNNRNELNRSTSNNQSDWFTNNNSNNGNNNNKQRRNFVNRFQSQAIDYNHSSGMNNFDDMPASSDMPTSACPKENTNGSCQTGAHPKSAQSPEQNGNGLHPNGLCFLRLNFRSIQFQYFNKML